MRTLKNALITTVAGAVSLAGLTLTATPALADDGPTFLLSNGVVASEADTTSTMSFEMKVLGDHPQPITVGLQITHAQVKGTNAADFAQPLTFDVVVPANVASVKVPVKIAGDQKIEPDESFLIKTVSASKGAPANVSQKGTITNDDAPRVDVLDAQITESGLTQKLGVKLVADQGFPGQTDVHLEAFVPQGCTATPGADFTLPDVFAKVGFNGGVKERTAFVLISGDDVPEATECFGLRVVPSSKVEAGPHGTGIITIFDDEPLPQAPADAPKGPAQAPGQPDGSGDPAAGGGTAPVVAGSSTAGNTTSTTAVEDKSAADSSAAEVEGSSRRSDGSAGRRITPQADRGDDAEVSLADVEVEAASGGGSSVLLIAGIALLLIALAVAAWVARRRHA